jgi:hypothetical protein
MSFDLPSTDMVYITGLPEGTTEEAVAGYFGSIGVIKACAFGVERVDA